jgi:NitT/TauT family transport system substrate-binding protein
VTGLDHGAERPGTPPALAWATTPARAADPVRLGLLHTLLPAPFYIARERGYFRDAGINLSFRFFDSAQPIAAAAVAGDVDVGVTALRAGSSISRRKAR